jgi:predicted transcriptional regulator of viral defense system
MATRRVQPWSARAWELARAQHGVVTRAQLLELGMSSEAIKHRLGAGRLHRLARGVYAVGRPEVTMHGRWMAAVLSCGSEAMLSHRSAGALWGIVPVHAGAIDVAVPDRVSRCRPGIRLHRKADGGKNVRGVVRGIPLTDPVTTLIDLATCSSRRELEAAVNEADQLDLVDAETLRAELDALPSRLGIGPLRGLLDIHTFVLTTTELERRFLPIARSVGLPLPETQVWLNGHRVDFYWPQLRLVVEADSLRYHRTAAKQAGDQRRDHAHMVAGLTPLRFTHYEIRNNPRYVRDVLGSMVERLRSRR